MTKGKNSGSTVTYSIRDSGVPLKSKLIVKIPTGITKDSRGLDKVSNSQQALNKGPLATTGISMSEGKKCIFN